MKNTMLVIMGVMAILGLNAEAWSAAAQFNPPVGAFQMKYASNLNIGDSVFDLSNSGANQWSGNPNGNICVNVYVFDPAEEMIACCSCKVSPDGLDSLSATRDLISNSLTGIIPSSIVVKLLASTPIRNSCNASTGPTQINLVSGMVAWGTTLHALPTAPVTFGVTEEEFTSPVLSPTELTNLTQDCGFIQNTGSGAGICASCRAGGL